MSRRWITFSKVNDVCDCKIVYRQGWWDSLHTHEALNQVIEGSVQILRNHSDSHKDSKFQISKFRGFQPLVRIMIIVSKIGPASLRGRTS